jgi:hypothetical protein
MVRQKHRDGPERNKEIREELRKRDETSNEPELVVPRRPRPLRPKRHGVAELPDLDSDSDEAALKDVKAPLKKKVSKPNKR